MESTTTAPPEDTIDGLKARVKFLADELYELCDAHGLPVALMMHLFESELLDECLDKNRRNEKQNGEWTTVPSIEATARALGLERTTLMMRLRRRKECPPYERLAALLKLEKKARRFAHIDMKALRPLSLEPKPKDK